MNRPIRFAVAILALGIALPVSAQPAVSIDLIAEREVVDPDDGSLRRVPAGNVVPGTELIYTVIYVNSGTEVAAGVLIENPIPETVSYIPASATSDVWPVTFSINNGKTFAAADELTQEVVLPDGRRAMTPAPAELYTNVRWLIPKLEAGARGNVSYRARVR